MQYGKELSGQLYFIKRLVNIKDELLRNRNIQNSRFLIIQLQRKKNLNPKKDDLIKN